jgi:hypothetical protein
LENEALTIQEHEDRRREEEIPGGGCWIRWRVNTPVSPPRPNPNKDWKKSKAETKDLLALLNSGFLREKEVDMWCAAAGDPYPMEKNPDEIPMFMRFVERGLALPASNFFKRLLEYYGIEYLNLNPNGIFHTSVFVHFYEAFLGIKPHCHTRFSEGNQVQTYMHARIKFHAYSDIKVYTETVSRMKKKDYQRFTLNPGNEGSKHHRQSTGGCVRLAPATSS